MATKTLRPLAPATPDAPYHVIAHAGGPMGPMHDLVGPGGKVLSSSGGGSDGGRSSAVMKAGELNAAFRAGRSSVCGGASMAELLDVCRALAGWPASNDLTLDEIKRRAAAAVKNAGGVA